MRNLHCKTYKYRTLTGEIGHRRQTNVAPRARRSAGSVFARVLCVVLAVSSAIFCGVSLQKENTGNLLLADTALAAGMQPESNGITETPTPSVTPTDDPFVEALVVNNKRADRADVATTSSPQGSSSPQEGDVVLDPEEWDDASIDRELDDPDYVAPTGGIAFEQIGLLPGTRSEEVKELQARLMELEFMDNDEPTNYYGSITKYSVQLFQRQHGLKVDGIAGEETLNLLFSNKAQTYYVEEGASGEDVRSIQTRLKELNYNVSVTGYYGPMTKAAVRAFQSRNGVSTTGIVGTNTRAKLYSANAKGAVIATPKPTANNNNNNSNNNNTTVVTNKSASQFVNFAKTLLGKPYVRGGKGPNTFDCSGFVYYCLNQIGVKQSYMTSGGWAATTKYAKITSMSDLKVGDVLCFKGHVGIYLGNGQMIDASATSGKIRITGNILTSSYWKQNWICARRVFG